MLKLSAQLRKEVGKKVKNLRKMGFIPAILYGPGIKNLNLKVQEKEFEKVYKKAGESTLISLEIEGKKIPVLIHEVQFDPISEKPIHVDFYQPSLKEEIEAKVPLVFVGEAPAVKELGGTLVKALSEIEIKVLPQNLPHEIKVDISPLKTFEDRILVKNLNVPEGVKILRSPEDPVAFVAPFEKVEEELEKPVEKEIKEVEVVKKKKPEELSEKENEGSG